MKEYKKSCVSLLFFGAQSQIVQLQGLEEDKQASKERPRNALPCQGGKAESETHWKHFNLELLLFADINHGEQRRCLLEKCFLFPFGD